jgi:AFG1-like ATPase
MTLHPYALSPALHLFSQGLANRLKTYRPPGYAPADSSSSSNSSSTSGISSFFKSLFGGEQQAEQTHDQLQNEDSPTSSSSGTQVLYRGGVPLGLYMYGGVGTGATSTIQCAISHYTVLSVCTAPDAAICLFMSRKLAKTAALQHHFSQLFCTEAASAACC